MTIALIAHDSKKELMVQFCMAYRHILEQHRLLATGTTGRLVEENAGLKVDARHRPGNFAAATAFRGRAMLAPTCAVFFLYYTKV